MMAALAALGGEVRTKTERRCAQLLGKCARERPNIDNHDRMLLLERLIDAFEDKGWIAGFDEDFLPLVESGLSASRAESDAGRLGEPLLISTSEVAITDTVFWGFTAIGAQTTTDYGTLWLPVAYELRGLAHRDALTTLLRLALNGREAITAGESAAYQLLLDLADRDNILIEHQTRRRS
jgi:hypothetical protein